MKVGKGGDKLISSRSANNFGVKGGGKMATGQSKVGAQKPGVSGVSKGPSNSKFGATAGPRNGMFGKQAVTPARAGHSGKVGGGAMKSSPKSGRRGYGGNEAGNPY